MNLIEEFKHDAAGLAIIKDWLGAGGIPVHQSVADKRSNICQQCPKNIAPNWWDKVKHKIADEIKKQLEFKNRAGLKARNESLLAMCQPCGCCNQLSVWTPIIHIAHHTSNDTLNDFHADCWKRKEIKDRIQDA